jgi:hypothetical protein
MNKKCGDKKREHEPRPRAESGENAESEETNEGQQAIAIKTTCEAPPRKAAGDFWI